jgi:hypothetical protein
MAGGYGVTIHETVQVQVNTYAAAVDSWQHWQNHGS